MSHYKTKHLMLFVMVIALILFLFTRPTQAWSSALITMTILLLSVAATRACIRVDSERAAWIGFAIFGWAYLIVGVGPKFDCLDSPMLTNVLLKELFLRLVEQNSLPVMSDEQFIAAYHDRALEFFRIGHSILALLAGVLGAFVGRLLEDRRPQVLDGLPPETRVTPS